MVDNTQSTDTTQAGSSPTTGNTLQPLAQTGLQPQSTNNLQTPASSDLQQTSNQTINTINQLDQGTSAINLMSIANTGKATVTVQTTATPANTKPYLLYGAAGILVAGIMAVMVYRLLRPH